MFETGYTHNDPLTKGALRVIEGDADTEYMGYTLEVTEPPHQKLNLTAHIHRK